MQATRRRGDERQEPTRRLAVPRVVWPASYGLVDLDNRASAYPDDGRDLDIWEGFVADFLGQGEDIAVCEGYNCRLLEEFSVWGEEAGPDVNGEGAAGEFVDHDAGFRREVEEGKSVTPS